MTSRMMTAVGPMSAHTVRPMAVNTASGSSSACTAKPLKKSMASSLCAWPPYGHLRQPKRHAVMSVILRLQTCRRHEIDVASRSRADGRAAANMRMYH